MQTVTGNHTTPYFSIVVPAYNKEQEIIRCLESLLHQTYSDIEILVVDDGSTDQTSKILETYGQKDTRIRCYRNEKNESLLWSRIRGMREARGKYLLHVDADDYLSENACETLYRELEQQPCEMLEFQYRRVPSGVLGPGIALPQDLTKAALTMQYPYKVWNKCYSMKLIRRALEKITPFYCNLAEDGFFGTVFYTLQRSYRKISDVLYLYVDQTGMSNAAYTTRGQVENALTSVQNKAKYIIRFLQSERPDLVDLAEGSKQNDVRRILQLSTADAVPLQEQFSYLEYIDEMLESTYLIRYEDQLKKAAQKVNTYQDANIRNKLKLLGKAFHKDVWVKGWRKILRR